MVLNLLLAEQGWNAEHPYLDSPPFGKVRNTRAELQVRAEQQLFIPSLPEAFLLTVPHSVDS